jgi:hypothetical protein
MRRYTFPLIGAVCLALGPLAFPQTVGAQSAGDSQIQESDNGADPDSDDTYDVFYDRLSSDGQWLNDDTYGYVFQPTVASSDSWRPYSDGHWANTDRGWTWVSNENFGWATYHYGRWVQLSGTGWVWIPGNEWAPAWVSWRQTDDNSSAGWAPLPPEATVSARIGVSSWADNYYDIGPAAYIFVKFNDFWRPTYRGYYPPPEQNVTIINRTQNITNITYNNNVIINNGPQFQRVSQITNGEGHPLQTYQINYAAQAQRNAAYKTAVQGNQLNVFAPPQKLNAVARTQPQVAKQLGKAEVQRGWQNVQPAQREQLQQTFVKQAPVPANLPPKPAAPVKPQIVAGKPGTPATAGKPTTAVVPPAPAAKVQPEAGQPPKPGTEVAKPGQPPAPAPKPAQEGAQPPKPGTEVAKPAGGQPPAPAPKPAQEKAEPPKPKAEVAQTPVDHHQQQAPAPKPEQDKAEPPKPKAEAAQTPADHHLQQAPAPKPEQEKAEPPKPKAEAVHAPAPKPEQEKAEPPKPKAEAVHAPAPKPDQEKAEAPKPKAEPVHAPAEQKPPAPAPKPEQEKAEPPKPPAEHQERPAQKPPAEKKPEERKKEGEKPTPS